MLFLRKSAVALAVTVIAVVGLAIMVCGAIGVEPTAPRTQASDHHYPPGIELLRDTPSPRLAPYWEAPVSTVRVIDGDTVEVTVSVTAPVRLVSIDTPELRDAKQKAAARVARDGAKAWIATATADGHVIRARIHGLGLYGRLEGDLVDERGRSLAGDLLRRGLAVPTHGETRHEWTPAELKAIEAVGSGQ
jgi:endonuclease YncB( thermonuclease family)